MTINKQTANRFAILTPFKEAITYYSRNLVNGVATDSFTSYTLPRARARESTKKDLSISPELLTARTRIFEIWSPVMESVQMPFPQKDDYLIDSFGVGWTVFDATGELNQNVWTLMCKRRY